MAVSFALALVIALAASALAQPPPPQLCPPGNIGYNVTTCTPCTSGFASLNNTCVECATGYTYSDFGCELECDPLVPVNYFTASTFSLSIASGTVLVTALLLVGGILVVPLVGLACKDCADHPDKDLSNRHTIANYATDMLVILTPIDTVLCFGTRLLAQCCDVCSLETTSVVIYYSALSLVLLTVAYICTVLINFAIQVGYAHRSYVALVKTSLNLAFTMTALAINLTLLFTSVAVSVGQAENVITALLCLLALAFLIGVGGVVEHVGK